MGHFRPSYMVQIIDRTGKRNIRVVPDMFGENLTDLKRNLRFWQMYCSRDTDARWQYEKDLCEFRVGVVQGHIDKKLKSRKWLHE